MARISYDDLTIIYLTANEISESFSHSVRKVLIKAVGDTKIISVTRRPISFGRNLVITTPRSHVNIYWKALQGAKLATTEYIAIAEDDTLYSEEHFRHRPDPGVFAYNISCWGIYTWNDPPIYSHRINGGRRNHNMLICHRQDYIDAIQERFDKYPVHSEAPTHIWAEPGKYERQLGVTVRNSETYYTNPPNIMFSHEKGLSYQGLGTRKRLGEIRATVIPHWGSAENIRRMYV